MIATGGYPVVPPLPGAELGITSDGFFELEQRPRRVAIVGSGYVAVELAGVFNALGTETVLFVRGERLLRGFDSLLAEQLAKQMRAAGIEIVTHGVPSGARGVAGDVALEPLDGRSFSGFDTLLWASAAFRVPRRSRSSARPSRSTRGPRSSSTRSRIRAERIYAIGDVTGARC